MCVSMRFLEVKKETFKNARLFKVVASVCDKHHVWPLKHMSYGEMKCTCSNESLNAAQSVHFAHIFHIKKREK